MYGTNSFNDWFEKQSELLQNISNLAAWQGQLIESINRQNETLHSVIQLSMNSAHLTNSIQASFPNLINGVTSSLTAAAIAASENINHVLYLSEEDSALIIDAAGRALEGIDFDELPNELAKPEDVLLPEKKRFTWLQALQLFLAIMSTITFVRSFLPDETPDATQELQQERIELQKEQNTILQGIYDVLVDYTDSSEQLPELPESPQQDD